MLKENSFLIIGGTGSLGKQLISRLLPLDKKIIIYSRDEAKQWTMKNELKSHPKKDNVLFRVGDIRDRERIASVIFETNPEAIIIAAALKHVDTCEMSPEESIKTNTIGPLNVAQIIEQHHKNLDCTKVLMVSTDKACEPVNVYGMCKAISERIISSKFQSISDTKIKFLCTRYGNVLDSRGSIIPLFKFQSENSDSLTLTHDEMTRFVMTLDQSVDLIFETLANGQSGDTWVPKIPAMKIIDLAEIFSEYSSKPIKKIPIRPGEKIHETLISESESLRVYEKNGYYVVKSPLTQIADENKKMSAYSSNLDLMTKDQLRNMLIEKGYLKANVESYAGIHIDEIRK